MRYVEQCEGCEYPLANYLDEYYAGRVEVTWILCPFHDVVPDNGAETNLYEY